MDSACKAVNNFGKEEEYSVYGYTRRCQQILSYIIPTEIIALCLLFFQTERFKKSNDNVLISSSQFFQDDIVSTNFNEYATFQSHAFVKGAFKINLNTNLREIVWKFRILNGCPMRIGITADKKDIDTVLHINGDHRFHTLSYLSLLGSHRKQYSVNVQNIFDKNNIITMIINMIAENIIFQVDDENGKNLLITNPERINFCDEYRMVIYMGTNANLYYRTYRADGSVHLLDFQMSKLNDITSF